MGQPRQKSINFQIADHKKTKLEQQANSLGMTLSDFCRDVLSDYSDAYIRNAKKKVS